MSASLIKPTGPRIAIVGYGRHGKDEVAYALHGKGQLRYAGGTSWFATPDMASFLNQPQSFAWENRHLHRDAWKSHLDWLRRDDPCLLIRRCLAAGNIVAGIRDWIEIKTACDKGLFDAVLWVERPGFPVDPTVTYARGEFATDVLVNNGTLEDLKCNAVLWAQSRGFLP